MWGGRDTDFHAASKEAPPRRGGAAGAGGGWGRRWRCGQAGSPRCGGQRKEQPEAGCGLAARMGCALSEGDGRGAAGPVWEGFLLGLPGHMLSLQRAFTGALRALSTEFKSTGSLCIQKTLPATGLFKSVTTTQKSPLWFAVPIYCTHSASVLWLLFLFTGLN